MEGGIANFSPESASDPDGDSLSYAWDFGDGAREVGPRVQHLYIDDGVFTVTLVVSDPRGAADTANATVTINNYPPYISGASLTAPTMPAKVPAQVAVAVTFSDEGILDHPVMVVDWGDDGLVSSDTTHSYTIPGVYSVTVIVTDKDGAATRQNLTELIWVYDPSNNAIPVPGYEVVDLGTLGGEFTRPSALNNRGEVVGTSATAAGKTHAFLWRDGLLTDISPPGQDVAEARKINDAGWVAGVGGVNFSGQVPRWKDGVFTDFLPVPASEYGAWPAKILESGDVLLNVEKHEYPSPVFVRNGIAINLGGLASVGDHGWAADMNTHDQIVGSSAYQASGAGTLDFRAFLWEDGVVRALTNLGTGPCPDVPERQCGYSAAADINETGQIVGASFNGTQVRAVLWNASDRTPHDLGFGTGASQALAINERGQIVGESWNVNGLGTDKGFFRDTDGSITDLGSLGGGATHVVGMNEAGMVVGTSKTAGGAIHPFIWRRETGMVDLGVGPFGVRGVASFATAINDRGDVIGYAVPCRDAQAGGCGTYAVPARAFLWRAKAPATARR